MGMAYCRVMLPLESPDWHQLKHAYGLASDIPDLLRKLQQFPPHPSADSEPYFSLWSALCHQGDVYTASYAAVPHIVGILESAPSRAHWDFYLLPASIEIARCKGRGPEIPKELSEAYFDAFRRLLSLVASGTQGNDDETQCRVLIATLAVAKGQPLLGEAILELEPDRAKRFMEALFSGKLD